jgi:hypothetical protein
VVPWPLMLLLLLLLLLLMMMMMMHTGGRGSAYEGWASVTGTLSAAKGT